MEALGETVYLTPGSERNLKLTTPQDLILAESLLSKRAPADPCPFRVGSGYDVHKLVEERDLILCGVKVPHTLGLLGHSDADVALHALMDALLGAACMGDIGILVSDDPVAIDQACLDLVYKSDDPGRDHLIERIESRHGVLTVEAAAALGYGSREYELKEV